MKNLSKQSKILLNAISVLMIVVILGITYASFSQNLKYKYLSKIINSYY